MTLTNTRRDRCIAWALMQGLQWLIPQTALACNTFGTLDLAGTLNGNYRVPVAAPVTEVSGQVGMTALQNTRTHYTVAWTCSAMPGALAPSTTGSDELCGRHGSHCMHACRAGERIAGYRLKSAHHLGRVTHFDDPSQPPPPPQTIPDRCWCT